MNKLLRSLAFLLCACSTLHSIAQHEITFGYCLDTLSARSQYLPNEGPTMTFGCAILIPSARLQMLKGQKITRMRFACSEGITSTYAWAKNDLNGKPISKATKVGTTVEGWNEVTFNTPIDITGEDIYIGYSGNIPYQGYIYLDGKHNPNSVFMLENGEWKSWESYNYPSLCIQAFAQMDSDAPLIDLGVEKVKFDTPYTQQGNELKATVQVGNYGETEIAAPKMFYSVNGGDAVPVTTTGKINPNETGKYSFSVATSELNEGKVPLRVWAETNDNFKGNDSVSTEMLIYKDSYPHKVLCEHFTTLVCSNCPTGHQALAEVFKNGENTVWVAHHIGYEEDELTQRSSYDLQKFGINSAPLAMFDRRVFSISQSNTKPSLPINYGSVPKSVQNLQPIFDECANTPAFVSVDIQNNYDATSRELTTTVSGKRNNIFSMFYDQTVLTVELVEDKVNTMDVQTGSGETVHNNVYRQALTKTLGDDIEWDGDNYRETYKVSIPEEWNDKNVRVVAFVSLPTSDTSHADVLNANQLNINFTTGINNVNADTQVLSRDYYNLQGQRINQPTHKGAYIERVVTTQGVQTIKHLQ